MALGVALLLIGPLVLSSQARNRRAIRFFGLERNSLITITVGSFRPTADYDAITDPSAFLFQKEFHGEAYPTRGVRDLVGIGTASQGAEACRVFTQLTSRQVRIVGDEGLSHGLQSTQGSVVCVGSPTSNYVTHEVLDELPQEFRPSFTPTEVRWVHETFPSDSDRDYAVIARVKKSDRTVMICAGVDEEGTVAAIKFLQTDWRKLPFSRSLDVSFVALLEVDKSRQEVQRSIGGAKSSRRSLSWERVAL